MHLRYDDGVLSRLEYDEETDQLHGFFLASLERRSFMDSVKMNFVETR